MLRQNRFSKSLTALPQPPHLPGRRRLDVVVAAPGHDRGRQPVPRQFHRAQLGGQPRGQPVLVLLGVRAEPVRRPDFAPMPLDRLALPVVLRPRPAGTFTCRATYSAAVAGTSLADSGNRASTSKNFSNSANPSRVAPDLFRTHFISSSSSVQTSIRSSSSQSRRFWARRSAVMRQSAKGRSCRNRSGGDALGRS